jgi:hypothetical protein
MSLIDFSNRAQEIFEKFAPVGVFNGEITKCQEKAINNIPTVIVTVSFFDEDDEPAEITEFLKFFDPNNSTEGQKTARRISMQKFSKLLEVTVGPEYTPVPNADGVFEDLIGQPVGIEIKLGKEYNGMQRPEIKRYFAA